MVNSDLNSVQDLPPFLPFVSPSSGEVSVPRAMVRGGWIYCSVASWSSSGCLYELASLTDGHTSPWPLATGSPHSTSSWFWHQDSHGGPAGSSQLLRSRSLDAMGILWLFPGPPRTCHMVSFPLVHQLTLTRAPGGGIHLFTFSVITNAVRDLKRMDIRRYRHISLLPQIVH